MIYVVGCAASNAASMQVNADKCSSGVREEGTMQANAFSLHLPTNAEEVEE